jgi:hypothetical protein
MINLLESFGIILTILLSYIIYKEKNYNLVIFGVILIPYAIIWEYLGIGEVWVYTTPSGVNYSFYILEGMPLVIPLGWSLSMMLLAWLTIKVSNRIKISRLLLLFLFGMVWGLIFELSFVNLGYWHYLVDPQIANLRPNVPFGWGILTASLVLTFEILWDKFGNNLKEKPYKFPLFFIAYFANIIFLIVFLKFIAINIMDPLCMATLCKH